MIFKRNLRRLLCGTNYVIITSDDVSCHFVDGKRNSFGRVIYHLGFIVISLMLLKLCHRNSWLYFLKLCSPCLSKFAFFII